MTPALLVSAILCTSPAHAMAYASERTHGVSEPLAIDRVSRRAGKPVCGLYRGMARIAPPAEPVRYGDCFWAITRFEFVDRRREAVAYQAEVAPAPDGGAHGRA